MNDEEESLGSTEEEGAEDKGEGDEDGDDGGSKEDKGGFQWTQPASRFPAPPTLWAHLVFKVSLLPFIFGETP